MDKVFLKACRGEPTDYTPIWLNRQAGRYMPEYHQVKGDLPSLDFFKNPERAAKATLDAQRILGVDAAILFADLLPIMEPMGLRLDYKPGEGPVFDNPIRKSADVDDLVVLPADVHHVHFAVVKVSRPGGVTGDLGAAAVCVAHVLAAVACGYGVGYARLVRAGGL